MNFIKESYFNGLGRESTYSFGRAAERERATSVDLEALKNGINEVFEAVGGSSTEKETVLNYTLAQLEIDVTLFNTGIKITFWVDGVDVIIFKTPISLIK